MKIVFLVKVISVMFSYLYVLNASEQSPQCKPRLSTKLRLVKATLINNDKYFR